MNWTNCFRRCGRFWDKAILWKSSGELSEHFPVSKPTMSAHFSVLQEADLIEAEKTGRTILYRLKMSVLEDALLGFAQTFGWKVNTDKPGNLADGMTRIRNPFKEERWQDGLYGRQAR